MRNFKAHLHMASTFDDAGSSASSVDDLFSDLELSESADYECGR